MTTPKSLLVKICGITTATDAAFAAGAGADAIGVNFWPQSKRFVGDDDAAAAVLAAVPAGVLKVGVFVNATAVQIAEKVARLGLDRVQLHGDERADAFTAIPASVLIRAVRIRDRASFVEDAGWTAEHFLYDALVDGYGGGGVVAPWALIAAHARRPFLLAGGLNPANVADAIRATRPDGVDVASGVEVSPGRKDPARITAFVRAARTAHAASTTP